MNAELPPSTNAPVTEAELQAFVDGQLPPARKLDIESYLATRPAEALRLEAYRAQKRGLHALFDPVLNEPLPQRLRASARPRIASQTPWYLQRLVAGLAIAVVSGAAGWGLRGGLPTSGTGDSAQLAAVTATPGAVTRASTNEFTQRAAVAHAVYSPDARRAVEIDAANVDLLEQTLLSGEKVADHGVNHDPSSRRFLVFREECLLIAPRLRGRVGDRFLADQLPADFALVLGERLLVIPVL